MKIHLIGRVESKFKVDFVKMKFVEDKQRQLTLVS